jgi:peptide methionine sulfoxide reductase msrA/msrB
LETKYFSYQPEREDEVARRYRTFWSLIILSMLVLAGVILPQTALFTGKTANPSSNKGIVGPDTPNIVLGMGCFWGSEKRMQALNGVLDVEAGYAGGDITNPSYEKLHDTEAAIKEGKAVKNHAEVVKVYYDPKHLRTCAHPILGKPQPDPG